MEKYSSIMKALKKIEVDFPVNEWKIDGVEIWPILRVSAQLINSKDNNEYGKNKRNILKRTYGKICSFLSIIRDKALYKYIYFKDYSHNDYISEQRDIFFLSYSVYRKAKLDGKYYFTEIFPFLNVIDNPSYVIFESTITDTWKLPRYNKSIFLQNDIWFDLFCNKLRNFVNHKYLNQEIYCPLCDELYQFLDKTNVSILPISEVACQINLLKVYEKYFTKKLQVVKPKLVVVEWYYGLEGFALILAAKKMGIPTADLQHGNQDSEHYAYGLWPAESKGYQLLPDYFLVWGMREKRNIQKWNTCCVDKHIPLITGYPWIDLWKNKKIPMGFEKEFKKLEAVKDSRCQSHILFSMDYEMPCENVIKLIQSSPPEWQWWIRMHPVMLHHWNEFGQLFEQKLLGCNANWKEASSCPLPALLSFIDLNITYGSTIAILCDEWRIPSIAEDSKVLEGTAEGESLILIYKLDLLKISDVSEILEGKKNIGVVYSREDDYNDLSLIKSVIE
ncbi:hypothetical protein [Anaerovibrio sp. RM50]|uniref:hypothetical protein n=1 Tax=Anaerovibrio sp. RM50 TaxID=1200557 RepID=UPI0004855A65|nr:hypothetical protein [Anaerovibrio sp. RM50]